MQIVNKPQSNISKWLLKYRLIILLVGLLVVVPIITVTSLYVVNYSKNKKVVFDDKTITNFKSTYFTIEDDTDHQEINLETDDLIVKIKVMSIKKPIFDVANPEHEDEKGNYVFKAKVVKKGSAEISNVSISLVLQTDWLNSKSDVKTFSLGNSYSSNQTINYNQYLPKSPLWFVKVENPNLYVKLTYNVAIGLGGSNKKEYYFKNDLKEVIPASVIDES